MVHQIHQCCKTNLALQESQDQVLKDLPDSSDLLLQETARNACSTKNQVKTTLTLTSSNNKWSKPLDQEDIERKNVSEIHQVQEKISKNIFIQVNMNTNHQK